MPELVCLRCSNYVYKEAHPQLTEGIQTITTIGKEHIQIKVLNWTQQAPFLGSPALREIGLKILTHQRTFFFFFQSFCWRSCLNWTHFVRRHLVSFILFNKPAIHTRVAIVDIPPNSSWARPTPRQLPQKWVDKYLRWWARSSGPRKCVSSCWVWMLLERRVCFLSLYWRPRSRLANIPSSNSLQT